jgi:hypothetical protein
MADPSRMRERIRLPLVIPVHPYLRDHHFEGKVILPAVEILQRLAGSVLAYRPDAPVRCMRFASFNRFLHIERDAPVIEVCHELEVYESGRMSSKMITVNPIKGTTATRIKIHAVVNFMEAEERASGLHVDRALAPDGMCYRIPSQKLYSDLVPFGPSYQNVRGDIFLSDKGAAGQVYGAGHPAPGEPLGSPFVFDGALHIACAWGQRFHHIVAFPVGFEERLVVKPTAPGETCLCRILFISVTGESLKFDIYIHDAEGDLREEIRGVIMRDVSGGRVKPPEWVLYGSPSGSG